MTPVGVKRRDLATVASGLALGASSGVAMAVVAKADEPDPHPEWLQCFVEARNRCDDEADESISDRHYDEMKRFEDLVLATPACTAEGALARVALLADIALVSEVREAEIRPALDNALGLLRIRGWRHP